MNQMDGIGMKKPRPLRYRGGKGEQVTLIGELHSITIIEVKNVDIVHALRHICIPLAEFGIKTNDSVCSQKCFRVRNLIDHIDLFVARGKEAGWPEKLAFYSGSCFSCCKSKAVHQLKVLIQLEDLHSVYPCPVRHIYMPLLVEDVGIVVRINCIRVGSNFCARCYYGTR